MSADELAAVIREEASRRVRFFDGDEKAALASASRDIQRRPRPAPKSAEVPDRIMGSGASRAVGRFRPGGPTGYRAASAPDAPLRATREEAVADERAWQEREVAAPERGREGK